MQPLCRVEPEDSADVAEVLTIVRHYDCHFAVLGGGTSPFKGASSAIQGVTIDMRRMRNVTLIDNGKLEVRVGGGSRWADVYRTLDPFNMSATGTSNSLTGVVGSILGGKLLKNFGTTSAISRNNKFRWNIFLFRVPWLGLR